MFTLGQIQVLTTFGTDPFTIRFTKAIYGHFKQQVVAKDIPQVNVSIFRNDLLRLIMDAVREKIDLIDFSFDLNRRWLETARTLSVNFTAHRPLKQQALLSAR